ncbi:MAG: nitrate ABC transporter ATP-binding protein [Actinomycetales bacterium]|nr:MAG: nitrate ABC transporter ATP-binding protein [Actinomycetales bacterium]
MVKLEAVSKSFNGHRVLSELSFHLQEGEIVGLLGRSGVGKTTVLQVISGLTPPDSGSVRVAASRIGYIFQEPRLIPWKTAMQNVCFPLKALGLAKNEAELAGRAYLARMDLMRFADHYPHQLSGGMRQRVSIARAFVIEPDLLLMDEPFSALDPELKESMHVLIREMLTQRPITALYVSHNPAEVSKIAHKVCVLSENGELREMPPEGNLAEFDDGDQS